MEFDATKMLAFVAKMRAAGHHVTPTHVVGRGVAHAMKVVPDLNVQIRGGRARPRPTIDIFFITAVHGGHDLSGVKVEDVPSKDAAAVAVELGMRSHALKRGEDAEFTSTKRLMDSLPHPLLKVAVRSTALLTQTLGFDVPSLGLHAHPFGSAMVTSIGMFGLPEGFVPIAWMYDVPLLVCVGEIVERPVAIDGAVVVRPVLPLTATIDHRYVDGFHISRALAAFRAYLDDPEASEPAPVAQAQAG